MMQTARWLAVALLLSTVAVLQTALVPATGVHVHTAVPVYLIIFALARRLDFGPTLAVAASAGLLIDLTPPGAGRVGLNALVAVLAAAAMHAWSRATSSDAAGLLATLILLVIAVALTTLTRAWLTDLFGASTPVWVLVKAVLRDSVVAALLTPITLPLVDWLARPRSSSWGIVGRSGARR